MLTYTAHGPHKADFRIRADGAPVGKYPVARSAGIVDVRLTSGAGRVPYPRKRAALYLIDDLPLNDDARRGLLASRLKPRNRRSLSAQLALNTLWSMSDENSKMFTVERVK